MLKRSHKLKNYEIHKRQEDGTKSKQLTINNLIKRLHFLIVLLIIIYLMKIINQEGIRREVDNVERVFSLTNLAKKCSNLLLNVLKMTMLTIFWILKSTKEDIELSLSHDLLLILNLFHAKKTLIIWRIKVIKSAKHLIDVLIQIMNTDRQILSKTQICIPWKEVIPL